MKIRLHKFSLKAVNYSLENLMILRLDFRFYLVHYALLALLSLTSELLLVFVMIYLIPLFFPQMLTFKLKLITVI